MQTRKFASRGAPSADPLYPACLSGIRIRTHVRTLSGRQVYLWSTERSRSRLVIKH